MPAKKEITNEQVNRNMRFYAKVMDVPEEAKRSFNNGRFSGTDINPMWRIQMLTELFGPAGFGWWTQNVKYEFTEADISPRPVKPGDQIIPAKEISVFCELELIVKDPETGEISQPIYGIGGNTYVAQRKTGPQASDEAKKMAYTDALSIACKSLGFGHSVWYQNDRTKYTIDSPMPNAGAQTNSAAKQDVSKNDAPAANQSAAIQQEHTPETATVLDEITTKIKAMTSGMDKDQKQEFAKTRIYPILGVNNYMRCTDITKLIKLRDTLTA